ncbi:MAG: sugar phosphate isomerase/epimerase [Verrucomicrobia bacterium]|nr:MAG: sugar phosphate isomerase/epimerase [Verrucomicrobiota bacterium]
MNTASTACDRRSFLKCATLAAGALAGAATGGACANPAPSPATGSPQPGRPVLFKAVMWGMIREPKLSVEDKFKLLADLGFDGVELDSPGGVDKRAAFEASWKTGVTIHGVVDSTHWQVRLSDPNPEVRERGLKDLLTAIRECHVCGGQGVLLVPGHGQDGSQEEVAARSLEQIRKAVPLAAKLGVRILIENVWNHFGYQHDGPGDQLPDRLVAFIDAANSPWVGSYFDVGNHRKYGVPSRWLRRLGHRVIKLHIKDFDHRTNKWAEIGEGTVDWDNLRAELARLNFCGWATAEVGGGDRKRLATIKAQMDRVLG